MPKNWGLQFTKRVEDFGKQFAAARCAVTAADEEVSEAERNVTRARAERSVKYGEMAGKQRALVALMDMGPEGLRKIEGEHEPEMNVEQFLVALDKRGIR